MNYIYDMVCQIFVLLGRGQHIYFASTYVTLYSKVKNWNKMTSASSSSEKKLEILPLDVANPPKKLEVKYTYFPIHEYWDKLFVPILSNVKVVSVRDWILKGMRKDILEEGPGTFNITKEFKDKLKTLDEDEGIKLLNEYGWGKFSYMEDVNMKYTNQEHYDCNLRDYKEFVRVADNKYDNPQVLGHYLYYHQCYEIALLIFAWVKVVWSEKKWAIVKNDCHAFVINQDEPSVAYDILWQYLDVPASYICNNNSITYTDPVKYYAKTVYNLNSSKTDEELKKEAIKFKEAIDVMPNNKFWNSIKEQARIQLEKGIPGIISLREIFSSS